jgi:hypothetical protein
MRLNHIALIVAVAGFLLPTAVYGVDGVILIDQNKALAGNVTPGDTPGFPVIISQPGSYRLDSNYGSRRQNHRNPYYIQQRNHRSEWFFNPRTQRLRACYYRRADLL